MYSIKEFINKALESGACDKAKVEDWKDLAELLYQPIGVEFCERTGFPTIEQWEQIPEEARIANNIYVNGGKIRKDNESIVLVGSTRGELYFEGVEKIYKVVVMHGAEAFICPRNHAVVRVYNIGNNKVDVHRDNTSIVMR